jgi:hypothetical protein
MRGRKRDFLLNAAQIVQSGRHRNRERGEKLLVASCNLECESLMNRKSVVTFWPSGASVNT